MQRWKWMFCGVVGAVALLALTPAPGAQARPFTFEDMIQVQTPGGVVPSPDGRYLAFGVSGRVLESNDSWSHLYLLDLKGGEPIRVTAGGDHEGSAAWSPDSKTVAFVSNKSGKGQIWLVDPKTPDKATQLTDLATGASEPRFASDGAHLFFTSRVFPHCETPECNRQNLEERDANPVKARLIDGLMYRHWDSWGDGRFSHVHRIKLDGSEVRDLMVENDWGIVGDWDVTPDDQWVYMTTKNPFHQTLNTNNDLYRINVAEALDGSRAFYRVTSNPAYDGHPAISPDGKWLAWHSMERPGFESDLLKLTVRPIDGEAEPTKRAAELDRPAFELGWFPGSDRLWISVADAGRYVVYGVDRDEGEPKKLIDGAHVSGLVLSPDGKTFYCIRQTLRELPEVWSFPAKGGKGKALTALNKGILDGVELADVEEVWWPGADGDKSHGFLLYPPGTSRDRSNPFLLLIHGGPQGMWSDQMHPRWNAQLFAAPGYVTLLANPRGSIGYGQKFTDQISRDWGGKAYEDLMAGVDLLIQKGVVDPHRMCAAGGSYGGYMVNWILGHTDRFKCLISHAGVYDLSSKYGTTDELWFPEWEFGGPPWESEDYAKWSPSAFVKSFKTPTLVIHGEHDYRVCVNQAMQLFTALQRLEVPSKYLYFPDETHFVVKPKNSQLWYRTVHEWLHQWMGE